jgi:Flp pilus assembly protein TadB
MIFNQDFFQMSMSAKREWILIAGILLFMIGLLGTGLALIYSVIIAVAIYVGIKVYVGRKNLKLRQEIPEGICAHCGNKIIQGKCPNCDIQT